MAVHYLMRYVLGFSSVISPLVSTEFVGKQYLIRLDHEHHIESIQDEFTGVERGHGLSGQEGVDPVAELPRRHAPHQRRGLGGGRGGAEHVHRQEPRPSQASCRPREPEQGLASRVISHLLLKNNKLLRTKHFV